MEGHEKQMCSLIIINATIRQCLWKEREREEGKHDTQHAYIHTHTACNHRQRTNDALVSSFFIKFHHGCPILIVFICWEMFVNVISFNFDGTFLLRRTQTSMGSDRCCPSTVVIRSKERQHLLCTLCVFCTFAFVFEIHIHYTIYTPVQPSYRVVVSLCLHPHKTLQQCSARAHTHTHALEDERQE